MNPTQQTMRNQFFKRWSHVINCIFIPISLVLLIYISVLTRSINVINNNFIDVSSYDAAVADVGRMAPIPVMTPTNEILLGPPINLTSRGNDGILRYTAVQRTGSSAIEELLSELGVSNDFVMIEKESSYIYETLLPGKDQREHVIRNVADVPEDAASFDTFGFLNFTEFNKQQPIYVSMVRFPVQRAISQFYAARASALLVQKRVAFPDKFSIPPRKFLLKSLESCLNDVKDKECNYKKGESREGHLVQYFCGHENICIDYGDRDGFKKAKEVVEKLYVTVGITEEMNKTLVVLENFIPRYFTGAYETYYRDIYDDSVKLNKNEFKPDVEPWVIESLEDKLDIEIEFYHFLRQRLNRQYEQLLQKRNVLL